MIFLANKRGNLLLNVMYMCTLYVCLFNMITGSLYAPLYQFMHAETNQLIDTTTETDESLLNLVMECSADAATSTTEAEEDIKQMYEKEDYLMGLFSLSMSLPYLQKVSVPLTNQLLSASPFLKRLTPPPKQA